MSGKELFYTENELERARRVDISPMEWDSMTGVPPMDYNSIYHFAAPPGAGDVPPTGMYCSTQDISPHQSQNAPQSILPYVILGGMVLYLLWMR